MHKFMHIIAPGLITLLWSGITQAHGLHSLANSEAPVSGFQHVVLHLQEWAFVIIPALLIVGFAFRILKQRF
jgi:hypothetical protein